MNKHALTTLAAMMMCGSAHAATITFEPFSGQTYFNQAVRSEAGFNFTYSPSGGGYGFVGPNNFCDPLCADSGSNAFRSFGDGRVTITSSNNSVFSLESFGAATAITTRDTPLALRVSGVGSNGAVNSTFNVAGGAADAFTTFSPSVFANLTSLTFTYSATSSDHEFSLDNIVLSPGVAAAVPEPASWAMMIGGFGMIGGAMRRQRKVKTTVSFA